MARPLRLGRAASRLSVVPLRPVPKAEHPAPSPPRSARRGRRGRSRVAAPPTRRDASVSSGASTTRSCRRAASPLGRSRRLPLTDVDVHAHREDVPASGVNANPRNEARPRHRCGRQRASRLAAYTAWRPVAGAKQRLRDVCVTCRQQRQAPANHGRTRAPASRDEQEGSWTSAHVIAEKRIRLLRAWPIVELFTDLGGLRRQAPHAADPAAGVP